MIRFRLKELIADREFREGRRITISEVADQTGINRMTLSKMINKKGSSIASDNLDKLCAYFKCKLSDLAEYVPDDESSSLNTDRP